MQKDQFIYYFGYGANMSTNYLKNRRKVFPDESIPSKLTDFNIIMNMEGPNFIEPSFANIKREKGSLVEGVLHKISENELLQIINSEGENYELTDILVNANSRKIKAKTLIYKTDRKIGTPPSRRYMKILINAAIENNLSSDYIEKLKTHPYVYFPFLSEIFAIFVFYWVWSRSRLKS
tara:strand:+ start:908 stop:1441 length:534 start_codon:yes stop_codon:yes gene_type:complete